jgi:hypothetical protein
MKQSVVKGIKQNALLIIALIAFVVFSGDKAPGIKNDAAAVCCIGYNIPIDKLKQFMLDSLHSIKFEGGVYSKAKLINAINNIPGDSVYLMNVLKNCDITQGTDLALTSPQAAGVTFAAKPGCTPCPPKACCSPNVCAPSINWSCINFKTFHGPANSSISASGE